MVILDIPEQLVIKHEGNDYVIQYLKYREHQPPIDSHSLRLLDIEISVQPCDEEHVVLYESKLSSKLQNLIANVLALSTEPWFGTLRLGISTVSGYAARSRCFEQRFRHCHHLGILTDNTIADQYFSASDSDASYSITDVLDLSVFSFLILGRNYSALNECVIKKEVNDIFARTSFSWLLRAPSCWKTIVLVHGRDNIHHFYPIYASTSSLKIRLVILDRMEHWLQNPSHHHLYDHFIPMDMTIDDNFHLRIVNAISDFGHVDGICTVSDRCLYPVARAADILGLPTAHPLAVQRSINKYETRLLDDPSASSTALLSSTAELDLLLQSGKYRPDYPLIVKPCQGWGSELVCRVNSDKELHEAVNQAQNGFTKKVLVEAYIDGPEMDVNFILHEGHIVFFEIADDFPSTGDNHGEDMNSDFWENSNVLPSGIPANEYACVRGSMYKLLLRLGFRTGVFHLEARLQNSSMAFTMKDGCMDLRQFTKLRPDRQPRCFIIEVNPRPPGFPCVIATQGSYGVNMFDAHLLASLGDYERLQMLSQPFAPHHTIENHARMWSQIVFFKADRSGLCTSDDPCGDFIRCNPEFTDKVMEARCFYKKGDMIPVAPPGVVLFGAFFVVVSSTDRDEVVRLSQILRNGFAIPVKALLKTV